MARYANGRVPESALIVFKRGRNSVDGDWYHGLPPATYARHVALVRRAKERTGRDLAAGDGWTTYRPLHAQEIARRIHGNWAAVPGTSSHGGFWENRETMAVDYSNWSSVYRDHGGRDAFFEDCRAVGLTPGMIMASRGYPDEPWHVIDLDPWGAVPAFTDSEPFEEDDMTPEQSRQLNAIFNAVFRGGDSMKDGGKSISQSLRDIQDKLAPVTRGGKPVTLRQEIASTRTGVEALLGRDPGSGNVEVDEAALAASLAPLIMAQVGALSDEDVKRLAAAVNDEAARRLAT